MLFCYEVRLTTLQIKVYKTTNILLFSKGFALSIENSDVSGTS